MQNSLSGESSFNGFEETNYLEETGINDEAETEISASPSEPEKLFVDAVRKLSTYEHSLETLVKRFDKDGIPIHSGIQHSETGERFRNADAFADNALGSNDLSAGGDHSASGRERHPSDVRQKYVKIHIPFRTAEIILRILNEDMDKNQRSALKQAESHLNSARRNLVTVKEQLQIHLENSDKSQEPILMETNEIADEMFTIINRLNEKLVECQLQNLSELLVRSMNDETRLSMLAKRPRTQNNNAGLVNTRDMVRDTPPRSKVFFVVIFCCIVCYFVIRLMMLCLEQEKEVLEKGCLFIWQPFREEILQLFVHLRKAFDWLIRIPFCLFK